jgi:flagellar secretion chaperone FliS
MSALPNTSPQANAYLKTKVMTASPEEIRLMLLEGAIKFAMQGREGLFSKNFEQSFVGLSQAREIVMELLTSVRTDPNPELAAQIRGLYTFIYQQLVEASFEKSVEKVNVAIDRLEYERETWLMVMQKLAEEKNAQPEAKPMAKISVQG